MAAGRVLHCLLLLPLISLTIASTEQPPVTECFASHTEGPQSSNPCTVPHLHHARLYCPINTTSARWWHVNVFNNSDKTLICDGQSVCELQYNLGYPDSGVYKCEIPANGTYAQYYLNVTVLAPPYLLYQRYCTEGSCCKRPAQVVMRNKPSFSITVEFAPGVGNFSVEWTLNPLPPDAAPGNRIDCSDGHCTLQKSKYKQTLTLYSQGNFFNQSNQGLYIANVTGDYGHNCSQTEVTINCDSPTPSHQTKHQTKKLTQGQRNVVIECDEEMSISYSITVCYAPNGEELDNLNLTESCIVCPAYHSGECSGHFSSRPNWYVSRDSYTHYYCEPHQRANLTIPHVHKDDDGGKVYCKWSVSTDKNVFAVYTLSMQHPVWHTYASGAGGGGGLLLLILAIAIFIGCYVRRRRKSYQLLPNVLEQGEQPQREQQERREIEGDHQERRGRRERKKKPAATLELSTSCEEDNVFPPIPNGRPQSSSPVGTTTHMENRPRIDLTVDRVPLSSSAQTERSYGTFTHSENWDTVSLRPKPTDEYGTIP